MKKYWMLYLVLSLAVGFTACSDDDKDTASTTFLVEKFEKNIAYAGGSSTITLSEAVKEATSDAAWCVPTAKDKVVTLAIEPNSTSEGRTAIVTLRNHSGSVQRLPIFQMGIVATVATPAQAFTAKGGASAVIPVDTEAEWNVSSSAETWCKVAKTEDGKGFIITVLPSEEAEERTAEVSISIGALVYKLEVKQEATTAVYAIVLPESPAIGAVYKVMVGSEQVAEIAYEYLRTPVITPTTNQTQNGRELVVYPMVNGTIDLTKGFSATTGASVVWNKSDNTLKYTAPEPRTNHTTLFLSEGKLSTETGAPKTVSTTTVRYTIDDVRGSEKETYNVVKIGTQYWMAENLRTKYYRDGSPIKFIEGNANWSVTEGAFTYPEGQAELYITFGGHYNGYAVESPKGLAPEGWEVPNNAQWTALKNYLSTSTGAKLRSKDYWSSPSISTTNTWVNYTGFNGYPAGYMYKADNANYQIGAVAYWWSRDAMKDILTNTEGLNHVMIGGNGNTLLNTYYNQIKNREMGMSVRCIRK